MDGRDVGIGDLGKTNIFAPALQECPYAFYRALREAAPVLRDEASGIYQVSSYELIAQVLRDSENFSNNFGDQLRSRGEPSPEMVQEFMRGYPPVDTMLTADPPAHTRFRKLVNKAFTPARVNALEPEIERISHELVDGFIGQGEVELLSVFAQPLPLRVIATQLGVPLSDMGKFRRWSDAITTLLSQMADPETELQCVRDMVAFQHYFAGVLAEKRRAPTEDIISDLATVTLAEEGDARPLNDAEALSIIQQILVAGNETTANSVVGGMKLLLDHPEVLESIREQPSLIPGLVEEVLRLTTAVQNTWRLAAKDVELGGVLIPKGAQVMLRFGSGNRDEAMFPDGEAFDPARGNARKHLSFGMGIHMCLGASLSRKELAIAFTVLLNRVPDWRFAPGKNDFTHHSNVLLRGLKALHLAFAPQD
jgi:cytochrome P450